MGVLLGGIADDNTGATDPARISRLSWGGEHLGGDKPSKKAFLHLAMYQEHPDDDAIVHLHSSHSVAVSCMADLDEADVLPPITAYYVMRIGKLSLLPYYRPGDMALAGAARSHHAMLLANHGPVVAGKLLDAAVYNAEELEETAKLFLMLRGCETRWLNEGQIAALREAFPN